MVDVSEVGEQIDLSTATDAVNRRASDGDPISESADSRPSLRKSGIDRCRAISLPTDRAHRPLSVTGATKLREDCTRETDAGEIKARTWQHVVEEWRNWWTDARDTHVVFEDGYTGDRMAAPAYNRFDPEYNDKEYARLKDLEAGLEADYGKRLHTAMLTFTASSRNELGGFRCPADHLEELLSSHGSGESPTNNVVDALRYELTDKRSVNWEYVAILEPHQSGYAHVHMAVFVDGPVAPSAFEPAIDAHVRNCEIAERDAHEHHNVIDVRHAGADRASGGIENLGAYLAEYLGMYADSPLDAPEHAQMFDALLWATGRRRIRKSQGAEQYMVRDSTDEDTDLRDWEFLGISFGPDLDEEEIHEADADAGGVDWVTIDPTGGDGVDPPPDPA